MQSQKSMETVMFTQNALCHKMSYFIFRIKGFSIAFIDVEIWSKVLYL